jgi:opacity protein-like surface antigen
MKSLITVVVLWACLMAPLQGQDQIGVKGGINFTNYAGDVMDNKIKVGFHVGAFANFKVIDQLFIQPELLYSLQGARFQNSAFNLDYNEHLHYINVPILARYFITENISVYAGPYVGVLIAGKAKGNYFGTEINEDIKDHRSIKTLDFGAIIGIAYQLANRMNVGARIQFGLANIAESPDFDPIIGDPIEPIYEYDMSLKNRVIQVYVGIPLQN